MLVFNKGVLAGLFEKALKGSVKDDHEYIYRKPIAEKHSGKSVRRYKYFYVWELLAKPFDKLKEFFNIDQKQVDDLYEKNNIQKDFNADKKTFAQHLAEYFAHRSQWDKRFGEKDNQAKFKKNVKMATFKENVDTMTKDMDTPEPESDQLSLFTQADLKQTAEKKKKEWKANPYLMRRIWGMFTGKTVDQQEKEKVVAEKVVETPTSIAETKVTETVDKTPFDVAQETGNDIEAIAAAMEEQENKEVAKETKNIEADKTEFKALVDRYNELEKEFKSNGGWSNRRTTREEDGKRKAARKGLNEVEKKIRDFKSRIEEEGKDSFEISSVYTDVFNEWIKRKVKGQTVSTDWLDKKLGGYDSSLPFADGYSLSLSGTEDINNPVVRIAYKEYGSPGFVAVDIGKMGEENYRPRFMPRTDEAFTDVYKKLETLKEQLNSAPGNTMAEKLFNTVAGLSNAYNENSDTSNIPTYRFTKDGIKDKSGKLEKINATLVEDNGKEYIRLYADDYSASIPSIFYPENNTDSQTDYFEKDHCAVNSDHPYFNHLKVMALKNALYRGRATKYGAMAEEQQKDLEKQIKDLESQLVEPTEEELKAYRERRNVEEENKKRWEEAKRAVYRKEQEKREKAEEEEKKKRFKDVVSKLYEVFAGEPPLELDGLSKDAKIKTLESRILKLGFEINNIDDEKVAASKKQYREQLKQKLEEARNEPDAAEETEAEEHNNRSEAMMGNQSAKKFNMSEKDYRDYLNLMKQNLVSWVKIKDGKFYTRYDLLNSRAGFFGVPLSSTKAGDEISRETILSNLKGEMTAFGTDQLKDYAKNSEYKSMDKFLGAFFDDFIYNNPTWDPAADTEFVDFIKDINAYDIYKEAIEEGVENRSRAMMGNDNAAGSHTVETEKEEPKEEQTKDTLVTPVPTIDANVAQRINDISMSGRSGNVYQSDVNVEMNEFRNMFNYENMNPQQKEYFRERLNSYAGLVGSSYNEMASKRLAAGPSWVVAGPAKYNTKRFNQKMEAERRAFENFSEKKEKFIKNTEKRLKELKYTGGTESAEDVKKRVFDDYARGKWGYGDKVDNTDPYAVEKIAGKIKFLEDAHEVSLLYRKICIKNGISIASWADRSDEEKAKRKEVVAQALKEAKAKGISDEAIRDGIRSPFLSNQTAEIRRNKQRLEEMQKRREVIEEKKTAEASGEAGRNSGRVDFDGGYIYENPELDRIQIIYDSKPERDVIDKLKRNGFRWSPSQGAWQRQLNRNGRLAVNNVMAQTGINTKIDIDGAGEVKKSLPMVIIHKGRYLVRK